MLVPKTYGDVMRPLDIALLPNDLLALYAASELFREWLHLDDKVRRAEKISSWTEWSAEETKAYANGDMVTFSTLRGYSASEIADFQRCLHLSRDLELEQNDPEFCCSVEFEIRDLLSTEALEEVNKWLYAASEHANRKPRP